MSGGLPHPLDKTDDRLAELRLQVMSKTVMYCRLNNLFLFYFIFCPTIITKNKGKERKKKWQGDLTETIGAYERLGLLELWVRAV